MHEARKRLSEVIRAAERQGPQTITRRGRAVALVVPISHGAVPGFLSAWDVLRDDLAASLGGPPKVIERLADPVADVPLP
jgi:prevent-host-death family protein